MRRAHFETIHPVCPVCRPGDGVGFPLGIAGVAREENGHIVEGVLHCSNGQCLCEFPIVDGVPVIVANIRKYVSDKIFAITARRDLGDVVESMLGDCCGPGSAFDVTRQHLSSYVWDHYGDLDAAEAESEPRPGSMLASLEAGLKLAGSVRPGLMLDAGCSVGRSTFALAQYSQGLVLGVDLHFAMLRVASEILRHGTVKYSRRRTGLVYERREFPAHFAKSENVDFWACDAAALPFAAGKFSMAVNLNLLDCVYSPKDLLSSLAHAVMTGGKVVLSCPYDWSASATPIEGWIGGHSQRSPLGGSCEAVLRTLLTPGGPGSVNGLKLTAEREGPEWHVRLHDRSTMTYKVHLVVAERT
jgi:SAM-dependent methyltransferase/uncharacterized protein YbaR (Trm112 family)